MNYIRIFSKSSLVSSYSAKSLSPSEEVNKLHNEIEMLKQTVESLKLTIESRDAAIGSLAREKEKIFVELKTAQRINRNLRQQLEDERDMHAKEKDFFMEEIKIRSKKKGKLLSDNESFIKYNRVKEELKTKDEVIYNICAKYMKIKSSKMLLQEELKRLRTRSQKTCENLIILLQRNKKSLDELLSRIIEYCNVPPNSKDLFKILRTNSNLQYENTQLKVRLTIPIDHFHNNSHSRLDTLNQGRSYRSKLKMKMKRDSIDKSSLPTVTHGKEYFNFNHSLSFPFVDGLLYRSYSDSHLCNL